MFAFPSLYLFHLFIFAPAFFYLCFAMLQTFCLYCKDPAFFSPLLTIPALVLSAIVSSVSHHRCLPFISASPSLRSFYISIISALGLFRLHDLWILLSLLQHSCKRFSFSLPYLHSFYFCFTITTLLLKTEQKSGRCLIKYGISKTRNKHIVPAVLGSLKRH